MNGHLLDTHTWIWVQQRAVHEVAPGFFSEVESWQKSGHVFISAMSLWEIARLVADGLLDLGQSVEEFLHVATTGGGMTLLGLEPRIIIESTRLPGAVHRDPADRILVATAREHGLTLVTRDKRLLQYAKQGHLNARKP